MLQYFMLDFFLDAYDYAKTITRLNMQSEHIEELFQCLKEPSGAIFEIMSIFILESKCEGL